VSGQGGDESRKPGRPRLDAEPTFDREHALRVALRVFARDGFEGASVRQISREVGVSHTLLHHYFGSKTKLWEACIDHSFGAIGAELLPRVGRLSGEVSILQQVHDLVVQYVMLASQFPEGFQIVTYEGARGGERLDYILDNHVRRFLDVTQHMVETAGDLGLVRKVPWASLFFLVFSGGPALFALGEFAKGIGARPEGMSEHEFLEQHANATADMFVAALAPPLADTSKS
jgi:TetR/AcrR family transcriptional regulator